MPDGLTIEDQRVVAFIDILGVSELVADPVAGETLIRKILAFLEKFGEAERIRDTWNRTEAGTEFTVFSDSVVLSIPVQEHGVSERIIVEQAGALAAGLLRDGVLCRGGISRGRLYHRGRVLLGEGLVKAYDLERLVAKYPRIVIDDAVRNASDWSGTLAKSLLLRDLDGCWIVDVISADGGRICHPRKGH